MKGNKAQKAVRLTLYIIIFFYPLILFEADLGGLHIQELMLSVCLLGTLFYCFMRVHLDEWSLRKQISRADLVGILLVMYEIGRIVYRVLNGNSTENMIYDSEVLILSGSVK